MYFSTLWFDIFVQTLSLCNMNRMFYWHTEALWCFFEEFMISLSCDLNFGWFVEAEFWRGSPPLYWWSRHNKPLSALAISKGLSGAFWIVCNLREEGGGGWFMVSNHPSKMHTWQYGSTGWCMFEPIWVKLMVIELSFEFFTEWTE